MAGIDFGQAGGARRSVNADIQPIPMIDLMLVTIAFLLLTATWSQMARVEASSSGHDSAAALAHAKALHVEVRDTEFVLSWRTDGESTGRVEVPRRAEEHLEGELRVVHYPDLAARLESTWTEAGSHREASDRELDRAVLHTPDTLPYADLIAVLDAMHSVKRPYATKSTGAFDVTFAVD